MVVQKLIYSWCLTFCLLDLASYVPAAARGTRRSPGSFDWSGHEPPEESAARGWDHVWVFQRAFHLCSHASSASALRSRKNHWYCSRSSSRTDWCTRMMACLKTLFSLVYLNHSNLILWSYLCVFDIGVVFDSGDGVSHSVPVFEGYCLPHAVQRFPLAGLDVTLHLKKVFSTSVNAQCRSYVIDCLEGIIPGWFLI